LEKMEVRFHILEGDLLQRKNTISDIMKTYWYEKSDIYFRAFDGLCPNRILL
jgi:hypothetical protein